MLVGVTYVRNNKTNQTLKDKQYSYIYHISKNIIKARRLSILPTSLDIFDIQQHYVRILYEQCNL